MDSDFDINGHVAARLRETFGQPQLLAGRDYWRLLHDRDGLSIDVLLSKGNKGATIWVFDPNVEPEAGIFNELITTTDQLDKLIARIRMHMHHAETRACRHPARLSHTEEG